MNKMSKCVGNRDVCYGCGLCTVVCPTNVLAMHVNTQGFYVPRIVNANACTNCGLCSRICNYKTDEPAAFNAPLKSYAAWSNNSEIRRVCSSGGIGYEIAKVFLDKGYKICGARYNVEQKIVEHYIIENEEQLKDSAGSKYLQSRSESAFREVDLNQKYVVFGTPCQIDMWRRRLKLLKKEDNFLLVDFFCHGVPSYNIWTKYFTENTDNIEPCEAITWRDKISGWHQSWNISSYNKQDFWDEKPKYRSSSKNGDTFYFMFLSNIALNPACYSDCKYKECSSSADIRIGDLWGHLYANNEEGVSAVLTFTEKAKSVLGKINTTLIPHTSDVITEGQMKERISKPWYYSVVSKAIRASFISLSSIRKVFVLSEIGTYQILKIKKCLIRK